jgi:dinuclear metal center YbgI/SA1388 family protein
MRIQDVILCIESFAPLHYQESYDNAGLIIGNPEQEISSVLISVDVTDEIINEAIKKKANFIISHHPLIFTGLKKITGKTSVEKIVIRAIKHNIAIYSAHTNLDSVIGGVSSKLCDKIGLINCKVLMPLKNELRKLATFVPSGSADKVRDALFGAGAGFIGNYDCCSYNVDGKGTFRASEQANPFVGNKGVMHIENEVKVEVIFPKHIQENILNALKGSHPYEEVAYDIYSLENSFENAGMGMIGDLRPEIDELTFINKFKQTINAKFIRCTNLLEKPINRVAVCGGSGYFLLKRAIECKADIFISSDFKYHQFFEAENKIIIADIGHYESEQFTKEIIYDLLIKNFTTFAVYLSEVNTNPIHYI